VTIEAVVNRTAPYSGGQVWAGDIVSKHRDPTDVNYLLRPNSGEITTTTGYYKTPDIADINLNQTYHVAMVYDGDTLKFYRDGCLMSKIHATGNLFQNSWETRIGYYAAQEYPNENLIGYVNEVRIWNVARTQAQIQAYMNSSLPNPATQAGLLAYYTFDNLKNKQGNVAWNGTLGGAASINETNPNCNAIVNNCPVPTPPCNIIIIKNADTTVCAGSLVKMLATGGTSFSWSPSTGLSNPKISNPIATPSTTTKYYLTVTGASGCSKNDSVTITINAAPVIVKSNDTSICINSHVPLFASGGTTYLWSPSAGLSNPNLANPVATPLTSTIYYVTVTNATGCSKKDSVKVTVNNLPVIVKSNDTSICLNSKTTLSASGGFSYMWSPSTGLGNSNISKPVASPLVSTKYYVTVTNAAGCSRKDSIKITVNNLPVISKSNDTSICINSKIPLFANGGNSYLWTPSAGLDNTNTSNPLATPLATTKYYVTVANAAGCKKMDSVKITVNTLPVILKSNDTSICINSKISLFATGGNSYAWSPSTGLSNPNSSNSFATPLATTKYYVTVTNTAGCSKKDSVKITVNNLPAISKSNDTTICADSKIPLFATGGSSYAWSPSTGLNSSNSANPFATPLTTTKYYVTVSNGGCSKKDSVKIIVNNLPVISKSNDTSICVDSKIPLFASGGNSYTWSPSTGLNNPNSSNPFSTPLATTKYYITVTSIAGCSKKDSVKITVNNLPVVSKSNDTSICMNSKIPLFAKGGTSYSWSPSTGLNNANSATPLAGPSATTKYYVTVSNGGCSKKDSVKIIVNNLPVISKSNDTSVCVNSLVPLFATGGTAYSWLPSTGLDNSIIPNPVATAKASSVYYVAVKNAAGCIKMDSVKIKVNNLPVISKSNDTSICINSTAPLFASGGTSYSWFPATGLNNNNISNPKATPIVTTKYYLTVANSTGCTKKDSIKIMVNDLPTISKSNDTSICINSNATLFASGGTSYSWSPASSLSNSTIANPVAKPVNNTVYNVKVTNGDGCSKIDFVAISIKPVAVITKSSDTTICNNAAIKIFASGGTSYVWSPTTTLNNASSDTPLASPKTSTIYHVKITDGQFCVYNDSIKVSVRPAAVFSVSVNEQICSKTNQQLSASGGDTYTWSPGNSLNNPNSNNPIASPNQTTTYSVTIKENTCNDSATLFTKLTVLPSPNVKATKSNDISCTLPSTQLTALGAIDYSWTPASGLNNSAIANPIATPDASTVYKVIGKDQNGCTNSDSILVKVDYDKNVFYGLPNSFTPNGDGLNDCFGVSHWGQVPQLEFNIYNRWGQVVFHTNNSAICWDGTFKGQPQNAGVFVYIIKAKTACGNIDRKGIVTLLR
ncbi:MAG: gliding motility-associated C-terminal domain-containing protein, partial [Ginsengibacter sp.]